MEATEDEGAVETGSLREDRDPERKKERSMRDLRDEGDEKQRQTNIQKREISQLVKRG